MLTKIKFYRTGFDISDPIGINYASVVDYEPYFIGSRQAENGFHYLMELGPQDLTPDWIEIKPADIPIDILMLMDEHYGFEFKLFETNFPTLYNSIEKELAYFNSQNQSNANRLFGEFFTKTQAALIKVGCYPANPIIEISGDNFEPFFINSTELKDDCLYTNISCYYDENKRYYFSAIEYRPVACN